MTSDDGGFPRAPHGSVYTSTGERIEVERLNPDGGPAIPLKVWLPLFTWWNRDDFHRVVVSVGRIPAARIRAMEPDGEEGLFKFHVHMLESHPALVAFKAEPVGDPMVSVTVALPVQFALPGDTPRVVEVYEATPAMLRRSSDEWDEWSNWVGDGSVFDASKRLGEHIITWAA